MSTKTHTAQSIVLRADLRFIDSLRKLRPWAWRVAGRKDLTFAVVSERFGAPARYIPATAEIQIQVSNMERIDPDLLGKDEGTAKYSTVMGILIHELLHSKYSRFDLQKITLQFGLRHARTLAVLEEGRIECWGVKYDLNPVEIMALKSMILNIVMKDALPDEDDDALPPAIQSAKLSANMCGLLSARIHDGLVDTVTNEKMGLLWAQVVMVLDSRFKEFNQLAIDFAALAMHQQWSNDEEKAHVIVQRWMALEDELIEENGGTTGGGKPPEGDEEEPQEGGGGKGEEPDESQEGGGKEGEKPEGEGEGEGENKSGDDKDGADKGKPDKNLDGVVGDDDDGEVGDGTKKRDKEGGSNPTLGEYGASSESETPTVEDILDSLSDAIEEDQHVSGSRMRQELVAIHKASAAAHTERRRLNREAMKKWGN